MGQGSVVSSDFFRALGAQESMLGWSLLVPPADGKGEIVEVLCCEDEQGWIVSLMQRSCSGDPDDLVVLTSMPLFPRETQILSLLAALRGEDPKPA